MATGPLLYNALNGVFCLYKPAGRSLGNIIKSLQLNLSKEMNKFPLRPMRTRVEVTDGLIPTISTVPDLADHPLAVGLRYPNEDFKIASLYSLDTFSSGVSILGINNGARLIWPMKKAQFLKTLTLLSRPDTLSPKSSSSAPINPVRPGSARSNSPVSSARKNKTCYSETNSTISNSSEEDKKKNDKRTKTHKHGQTKKKPERDKKESQIDPKMELLTNILPKTDLQIKSNGGVSSDQKKKFDEISEDDPSHLGQSARTFISLSLGPNKSLARGPDPNLRSGRSPTPRGHDSTLCYGPSPTNICGPQKELLKGPQACLLSADTT